MHKLRKHNDGNASTEVTKKFKSPDVSLDMIISALKETCAKELDAAIYPCLILKELETYKEELFSSGMIHNDSLKMLRNELREHIDFRSTEKFYETFYDKVVVRSETYAPSLQKNTSMLLFRKFADIFLAVVSKEEKDETKTKNLSKKELAALQYLGGYVIRNMFKKYRNSKKYKNSDHQQAMALLKVCKTDSVNSHAELVSALSRGGLWQISYPVEKILVVAERRFCIHVSKPNIFKIEVELLVKSLMEFSFIQDNFKLVIEEAEINITKEVAKNVLYGILVLYIRIRAFSFAKDIVQKHKIKLKNVGKQTALRKSLKRMHCSED